MLQSQSEIVGSKRLFTEDAALIDCQVNGLLCVHPPRRPKGNNSSIEPDIRQRKEQQEGN